MSPGAPAQDSSPVGTRLGAPRDAELPFTLDADLGGTVPALAAFALVLARHRGEDEVVVRVATAAGSMPVRLELSPGTSAGAFTARVGDALALALAAHTLSVGTRNGKTAGGEDSDAEDRDGEIADGEIAGGEIAGGEIADGGWTVLTLDAAGEDAGPTAGLALRIDGDEPVAGALELDPRRVRPEEAARFLAHFRVARRALAERPERALVELPLLTDEERAERVRWNDTAAGLPHGVRLHAAFEAHADAHPHAAAVLYGDEAVTYRELEARANRLARHLRRRGVGPESRVGICVERGPRVVEAILGVLKAGGAYVPLDATYPPERLAGMVRTAGIRVLVTEEGPGAALEMEGERILLDRDGEAIAAESGERPDGGATPENLAYVIFTSGSTGEPKGIALAHRGVANNLADLNQRHGVDPADRVLLLSSLSFDMSVYETLGILAAGGAVVIPRPHELRDPAAWAALCRRHGVTLWNSAPALLGMLCEHAEARPEDAPAGLRLAFLGGDWVPVPLVDRVRAWAPGMRDFIVMGGATEASIHSIIFPVGQVDPAWRSIPYGVPMANQRARILDAHLREVPVGVAGELFLGGIGVARGYVGRAGFTAERFLPDPHAAAPGTRIYRTGDLARYGEDGTIELLGRIDHQVKIRGLRIEPGEIEAALRRHPAVARAVVAARTEGGESRLVAYLVRAEGAAPPEARELRARLRESLPDYMVPAAYVVLDRLPLSPNGKVDRRQLPAPPAEAERAPYVAPRTPAEAALAEIWAEVLGVARVGADDDFFALGGQSLRATRVATRVRERLGVELPLGRLFTHPTLSALAAALEAGGARQDAAPIPRVEGDGPFPLAPAQERLWLWEQVNPGRAAYNIPVALRVRGPLDAGVLERALDVLVERHDALRTVLELRDGAPVQRILPASPFVLAVEALPAGGGAEEAARRRLAEEGARPFDLAAGPLFRALLLRGGEEEHVLLLTLHHVVGDGWSTGLLLRELSALYEAFSRGEPSPLAPPQLRYADYAAWHRGRLAAVEEAQLGWWRERLAGAPTLLELPTDRPRPAAQSHRGAQHPVRFPAELVERARALGRQEGATLHMVLLAALDVVLARHASAERLVVGSAAAGRTHPDTEGLAGFFVNILPIPADLSGDPGFREHLRRVRESALEAYDRQDVPFDRLVEGLASHGGRSHAPFVQVVLAFQDSPARALRLGAARAEAEWVDPGTAQFDLAFLLDEDDSGVGGVLEYATDLFDAATAARLAGHLERVLEQAVEDADRRLSALELMDGAERRLVVEEWNRTEAEFPSGACIHQTFEAQAARTPDAVAVVHEEASLTYAALNERANRLARHLARLGVGPEVRVGVCLARGLELVVSLLAVLKAGGAYVPLDPAYPAERLARTLADAGVAVLLTEEALRGVVPAPAGARVVVLERVRAEVAAGSGANLESGVAPRNLAYLIYTSGSTGTPKGVAIEHESAVAMLAWAWSVYSAEELSGVLASTSVSFDMSVFELFAPLARGGRIIVVENALALPRSAAAAQVRLIDTVPSAMAALLESGGIPAGVTTVNLGGEALGAELVDALYARGIERVYDLYGPSEDTTFSTFALRRACAPATIGRVLPNSRAYVLDAGLRPVPVGVPGELYLGGLGVTRGYLGRPGLTASRYLPDPFSARPGARMYRTGDRIRWRADGTLEYQGRLDAQVKIRGFRVEPGEVEAALRRHEAVRACVVVARRDAPGETRLAAYVVGEADAETLRAHLRRSLPEFMVPAAFVALEALPLTPNGKVDRGALPAPGAAGAPDAAFAPPRTPVEEMLAGIWAEVLRRDRVGVTDDFFDLGGHSLLAMRAVSRISDVFGVELTLSALFEAPTVAEMAARLEAARRAALLVLPPVVPVRRDAALPLSFAQERLWFLHRMQPESAFYNVPMAVRLSGALDAAALERALGEIVRRHEVLRTVFREEAGAPVQVIAPFAGFTLPVEDLSSLGQGEREAAAERRAAEEAARPFDLSAGPLFRPTLLRLEDGEHLLLLCMHHIVSDEWSLEALFRELSALYAAYAAGRESPLPEPAVQYADYAVWQREHLAGEALDRLLAWWTERLAGAPALLELPADHPRPAVQSFRGAAVHASFPAPLRARLEVLGRGEGATLYMVLLGAFQVLLSKYAGSEDVVVGSPIAGRTRRETEELVGFFVNTLVLRTDLSGDPGFREVLRRVREATLGAYEHQELPFERLVEELRPDRSLSHSPLFQVMFVQHGGESPELRLPGMELRRLDAESGAAKFDLTLFASVRPRGIDCTLRYSTDLFDRGTIQRMLGQVERLLEQVAEDADRPISRLSLAGDAERRLLLEEWNRTEAEYPADRCLHQLFEEQAERTPSAPAVVCGDQSLSYRELDARANRLASHLRRLGVGPETRVAVCLERGPELIVTLLAVLKAGGAYVPLDPASPPERLGMMLADSAVAALVTEESLRGRVAVPAEVAVVSVDGERAKIAAEPAEGVAGGAGPGTLAYVIYTSGSTGAPKGVGVEHRGACNLIPEMARLCGLAPGARSLLLAPPHFDASVAEIFSALASGAALHLPEPGGILAGDELLDLLRRERITHTKFTPSALAALPAAELPDLATLVVGGEACTAGLVARWGRGRRFVNVYGPTEATVRVSASVCAPEPRHPSIGAPLANTRLYVLDAAGEPAPVGLPGELYIGGVQVARGYLGRPGLTAERFVPDPFGGAPGARLYRTGDRARWRADGVLEYLGRLDGQVKVRGYRIEPGEIEAALCGHAAVRDTVVVAREEGGDRRLVAYVVGGAGVGELRAHLRRSLPEYMVPAAFVRLDALPLTPNGKLDRRALPAPEHRSAEDGQAARRTPVEEALAGIWAEVLGRGRVGITDDFFELGGHSLLATRVVSRVAAALGTGLSVRALFEAPTVAGMAARVEGLRRAALPVLPPIVPVSRDGGLPLSFAQERLWFLHRLRPESAAYNVPVAVRLAGALDAAALERALGEVVRRHEALRTVFREAAGAPVQWIAPFAGLALPVEDLSGMGEAEREAAAERRAAEEAARPFDLAAGPLFRPALLRLGDRDHVLLLCMHHVVCDEWSLEVLFRELSGLYAAFRDGGESPLAELPVQYADYAAWQRERLAGEAMDRLLAWWTERLAGAPALLELPADHPRPAVQSFRGGVAHTELPAALRARLEALGRGEGATLYMVLLAAFQVLLGRYAGSDDVVVGSPAAGQTRREVEELIGFFTHTLVLRADLSGDPAFREVLRRVRAATLGAYEHQDVPFERLVAALQPERSLGHSPLFQALFVLADAARAPMALPGVEARRVFTETGTAKFDLTLTVAPHADGIRASIEYATDLFERATAERMLGHLARVLEQVAGDADVRLSLLELAGAEERRTVLDEWNRTDAEVPAGACIHHGFETQAARTPDAPAVVFEDESLTYRQLDERANRLARRLIGIGVGPEVRVGLCQERSLEMVVSLLAVLKAGGAYMPLDPGYPAERLRGMLDDGGTSVLLTQERLRGLLPARAGVAVVAVDSEWAEIARESAEAPEGGATAESLAYVIFTSGSTGRPKGVMNQHGAVVNRLCWMQAEYGIGPGDVVLQKTPVSFDVSVWELFWPLRRGATLVMARPDGHRDPAYLREVIERRGVTTLHFVPSMLGPFVEAADPSRCATLKRVVCSGEALPPALVERFHERFPASVSLHNLYGPTEAAVDVSHWTCARGAGGATVPIGRPVWNTRLYVLDAALEPVPVGLPGELYIGGAQVARGYLGRPGLTAERFVPDPFSTGTGARLYRTGDRARWRADGALEYLGRLDQQVKIRGFRIEPGEVEAVLCAHPAVRDARVVPREDAGGETRLVAYVVGPADADELRAHLRRLLPEHMVPAAIVALERLPVTPSGKLDRRALPAPDFAASRARYAAPRTPVEEVLAGVWCEVLGIGQVGVDDGFFALGGHSLLATRVASRVSALLGVELSVTVVFEAPTVAELAARVESARRDGAPPLPAIAPADRSRPMPLSFAQERLWFLHRLRPDATFYNHPRVLRLDGELDAAALERALGEIVRRHETLRTVFPEAGDAPVQVVAAFGGLDLPVEDLSALDPGAREREAARRMAEEAAWRFDLAAGPLFRPRLLRLASDSHLLLLTFHHVVTDGWSTGVLFRELGALYEAFRAGDPSPLPEPAVQYADFAAWQREHLRGAALERQLAWWTERMAGAPALLELPADHPRPPAQSFRGAYERVRLPASLLDRLRALGRGEGATQFMVLLGAFQVLLARHASTDDVVVGSPIAGRTRAEVEGLIGFFVNTLALRTDLSGDPSFREVLRRVREATLGAYRHQDLPFERLVEALHPERSLGHSPVVQVMFDVEEGGDGPRLPGLGVREVRGDAESVRFDLALTVEVGGGGGFSALAAYATDLFERATVARMLGHLERVLEQVAADPDLPLSRLELMGPAERAEVEGWSGVDAAYPDECVHRRFEAWATATPDATAVAHEGELLTYAELDGSASRLARKLRAAGVRRGSFVPFLLERGTRVPVAMLAAMKAGAAFVPLDPEWPRERLRAALDGVRARMVLAEDGTAALARALGRPVMRVETGGAGTAAPEGVRTDAGDPVYAIFTSGSTGVPKAAVVSHGAIANRFHWMSERFGAASAACVLQTTRHVYDSAVWQLLWPLAHGGRSVVPRAGGEADAAYLVERIEAQGVTMTDFVPSVFNTLVPELAADPAARARLASLRTVVVGGEQITPETTYRFLASFPGVDVVNLYGPTECAIGSICHAVTGAEGGRIPIGRPIANTRARVLDGGGRRVPAGVAGEIHLGGACVGLGYLGDARKTAEAFVPDPFSAVPGARLYRTGDLGRWRADGSLECLGRRDHQVKLRGFRIEPGEIEAALRRLDGVRDAAVVVRGDGPGGPRLVAYAVGGGEGEALRAGLRERLPEHMVPSAVVPLEALPLTPNGKLDRRALPAPPQAAAGAHDASRTPVEEVLAGIWAEVLGMDRVGVRQSFFDLGGHSLLATRAVSRVRQALGVELPLRALFEAPTVAELAGRVEALRRDPSSVLPPVVPAREGADPPLSFAQERLWFMDRLRPGSALFNVPTALRLSGALDAPALERALGEIVRRHPSLRTTIRESYGVPVQAVAPFAGLALPVEEVAGEDRAARGAEALRRVEEEGTRPFDLAAGPLFRPRLLRVDGDEHLLLLCMHHAVTDAWSLDVVLRELAALYGAYREGGESPLAEPALRYADFAAWQREHHAGAALERQMAYWRESLAGAPALLELPADHPRPAVQTYRGGVEPVAISAALLARLEALGRGEGATLFMVLLGAFQALLSKYAASDDVVVGTTLAGRTRREVEEMVGVFMNALPLRTRLDGDPAFREVLRRVRGVTLGAYDHQDVPFERLVADAAPERSLSHAPLFQVLFELHDEGGPPVALPGLEVEALDVGTATAKYDLSLGLAASRRGIRGGLVYNAEIWEPATVRRMVAHLERVLEQVADDPGAPLSRLRLIGEEERARVVEEWNRTEAPYPADRCIHQLFEAQAARTPDADAVTFGGARMTYRELDERANRVAHSLVRIGVGPEARVGLCLERGMELLPAILGVMKAGGAYVPVDPAHPAERIGYVLEDSAVSVVLTQERLRDALPVRDGVRVIAIDASRDEIARESADRPASGVGPENLAYVIYTSGSTGRPKGVAMHHRGVANYIDWGIGFYGADRGSGAPVFSSMAVDLTITNLLPLFAGRPVHLLPEENAVEALADALRGRPGFGLIKITPVHLGLLTPMLTAEEARAAALTLVIGADFLPAESTLFWQEHAPGVRLMNEYGPTETVVGCSAYVLPPGMHRAGAVPVGHPIQNLAFYVLDAHLEPVPVGLPGELYIGGAGVARGYLGRAALSAEKFVPDPFAGAGARMYRTGDRARWLDGGDLTILGRTDHQVKVRGYRVEPGEIEAALRRHPRVSGALVVVREDAPGDRRLVAYVTGAGGAETEALREHLRRSLPEYMVPSAFVPLDALPRTTTGKLDPRTLPAPDYGTAEDAYTAPRTPVEETLAEIWADVLDLDRVGVHDNFFALGGHSLLAMRMVSRIRLALDGEVSVAALFESPTVAGLASRLSERGTPAAGAPARPAGIASSSESLLDSIDDLSEEELDRLLGLTS